MSLINEYSRKLKDVYGDLENLRKKVLKLDYITLDHSDKITQISTYKEIVKFLSDIFKDLNSLKAQLDAFLDEEGANQERVHAQLSKVKKPTTNYTQSSSYDGNATYNKAKSSSWYDKVCEYFRSWWNCTRNSIAWICGTRTIE